MNIVEAVELFVKAWQIAPIRFVLTLVVALIVCFYVVSAYKARREARGYLHWWEWVVVAPFLGVGYPLDIALNYTVLSAVYGEWPEDGDHTITQRINHYQNIGRRWRTSRWPIGALRRTTTRIVRIIANWIEPGHIRRRQKDIA